MGQFHHLPLFRRLWAVLGGKVCYALGANNNFFFTDFFLFGRQTSPKNRDCSESSYSESRFYGYLVAVPEYLRRYQSRIYILSLWTIKEFPQYLWLQETDRYHLYWKIKKFDGKPSCKKQIAVKTLRTTKLREGWIQVPDIKIFIVVSHNIVATLRFVLDSVNLKIFVPQSRIWIAIKKTNVKHSKKEKKPYSWP